MSLYHLDWSDDAVMSPFPSVAFDWNTKSEPSTITQKVALPSFGEDGDTPMDTDTDDDSDYELSVVYESFEECDLFDPDCLEEPRFEHSLCATDAQSSAVFKYLLARTTNKQRGRVALCNGRRSIVNHRGRGATDVHWPKQARAPPENCEHATTYFKL